jgi:hypothetical protein
MRRRIHRYVARLLGLGVGLFVLALVVVNVVDHRRFSFAIETGQRLGPDGLRQLALDCTAAEEQVPGRYEDGDWPAVFRPLRPVRVSVYPGCTDITLFRSDDTDYGMYVSLRIDTTPHNQTIHCVSNLNGPQQSQLLWAKDPEFERSLRPGGRLATVSANDSLHDWTEWIVLEHEILVVKASGLVGSEDQVVARAALSGPQQAAIKVAVAEIGPDIRGHAFEAPVFDGSSLDITFTPDGSRGDGIRLHNAWRPDVKPLLDAISAALPPARRIPFESRLLRHDPIPEQYVRKLTWEEFDQREVPRLPWWCLWPRLVE